MPNGGKMDAPTLRSERLLLRPWQDEDFAAFVAMNADPEVMRHFLSVLDEAASRDFMVRIREHFAAHGFGFWPVVENHNGAVVGMVGLARPKFTAHFTPCVEIGWRLVRSAWGRGYAVEAARRVLDFAFNDLRLDEVVAFTAVGNQRSRKVMDRLGMAYNPVDDFDHPNVPEGNPLRRHVLYRIRR